MAKQKQDDQLEHIYNSSVRIRDVALKICQRRWTIGRSGGRGSGITVLAAQHDHDDDGGDMTLIAISSGEPGSVESNFFATTARSNLTRSGSTGLGST